MYGVCGERGVHVCAAPKGTGFEPYWSEKVRNRYILCALAVADPGGGSGYQTWGVCCFLDPLSIACSKTISRIHQNALFGAWNLKHFLGEASKHSPPRLLVITQYCRLLSKIIPLLHIFGKNPGTPPIKNSWIRPWLAWTLGDFKPFSNVYTHE